MAFGISENTTSYFLTNDLEFPRFQRKPTWKEKDNFKLCISVFKGYPIGVVIVNEMTKEEKIFLLDGRQRRQALIEMYSNPVLLYKWATKFMKLQPRDDEAEVRKKFYKSIHGYLQTEFEKYASNAKSVTDNTSSIDDIDYSDGIEEPTFDPEIQNANMKALSDLILLIHGSKTNKITRFQKMFLFDGIIPPKELDYCEIINAEYVINPEKLKKFIRDRIDSKEIGFESFYSRLKNRYKLDERSEKKLSEYLKVNWDYFDKCFSVIKKTDRIIINSKIGLIRLVNASPLDAQNIFSLINANGVKLTAEELLSSRPFWNEPISNPSDEVIEKKTALYKALDIDIPEDTVRWDLCATVMDRIDPDGIIFDKESFANKDKKDTSGFTRKLTMGFKLISALLVKGVSSNYVKKLEETSIDWERDIETIIRNFKIVFDLLSDCNYFNYLNSWKQSIMSLTSNTVALEFAALIYNKWLTLDSPTRVNATKVKLFRKQAVILLDRLIYEYCNRLWVGSSDSRLARDIHVDNEASRFDVVPFEDWKKVIDEFSEGKNEAVSKSILYHFYCLRDIGPTLDRKKYTFEKDHIIPQSKLKPSSRKESMNSLGNFAILPKLANIKKSDQALNQIQDSFVLQEVLKFTDIKNNDIDKYSNIENIEELIKYRIKIFYDIFNAKRIDYFDSITNN